MQANLSDRAARGTIQSVDRAARILKALASGPRRLGRQPARRPARPVAPHCPRAAADPAGARLRRAGPRLRQVPARRGPAAARQLLPRPQRAAGALDRARRAPRARAAARPSASASCTAPRSSSSTTSSAPTRRSRSSRSARSCRCTRARWARRCSPAPRPGRDRGPHRRAAGASSRPARSARRACAPSSTTSARTGSRASATRRCSARPASPRRSSTTRGHAVGAIGVVGRHRAHAAAGPARGLAPAVIEAARAISRELGAGRWPSARPTAAG